ncbi:MAG: hypothetical protein BZ138_06130, partial [Methanosphaera sp. rholeuAM270]
LAFWVEAKKPGKVVLAATTLDRTIDGHLIMTEATLNKLTLEPDSKGDVIWVPGLDELLPYIFDRTEEIIEKEGRAYNIKTFEDDEAEADVDVDLVNTPYHLLMAQIVEQHYKSKDAAFLMTGNAPVPYALDYVHVFDLYNMYLQIRAKGGGGDSIPPAALAEITSMLEWTLDSADNTFDFQYDASSKPGRVLVTGPDRKEAVRATFEHCPWPLSNLFVVEGNGYYARIKTNDRSGVYQLRPQRSQLTVMIYGTSNPAGPPESADRAWEMFDRALANSGAEL